jgi:hypothetical protein
VHATAQVVAAISNPSGNRSVCAVRKAIDNDTIIARTMATAVKPSLHRPQNWSIRLTRGRQ